MFTAKHYQVMDEEIEKPLKAGFIKEVKCPYWLANVVLIKKYEKWRVYKGFTDINKACLKENFSFFKIDQLVESVAKHLLLSFMNVYSGHN